ncbi:hypothetical protein K3495_g16752, partial [Podosphaera aphanis]
ARKEISGTTGSSQPASSLQKKTNTIPPELRAQVEAEERRAVQIASNLSLCTAAINGVEDALTPLSNGQNKEYIDSMRIYLRAAIAQFMSTGPGTSVPVLPPRPASRVSFKENGPARTPSSRPTQVFEPVTVEPVAKTSWAIITRRGQQKPVTPASSGRAPPKQPHPPRAPAKSAAPSGQDERLFLRLGKQHEWRQFSPAGVREAVAQHLSIPPTTIEHVYRVPSGFALKAKDEETRQNLLD